MVYGVFGGAYSDWTVEGYFENREDAEKYCAVKNKNSNDLYVKEIPKINADVSKVTLKYYHEVVFDIGKGMRNEPTRYEYFAGKDKPMSIKHNIYPKWGWIAISIMAKTRQQAEKIAQDVYCKFLNYYSEMEDYNKAAEMIGSKGLNL
jgi:hypothetical protein